MTRLRKLIATVLLTIPVLAFSAAVPPAGAATKSAKSFAAATCYNVGGRWFCY
jgi:hypothetical protein